jgi:DNA polymerase-1
MILQVHDELVFDVDPGELDRLARLVHDEMAGAYELRVPLAVEVKVGPNWDEVKPVAIA